MPIARARSAPRHTALAIGMVSMLFAALPVAHGQDAKPGEAPRQSQPVPDSERARPARTLQSGTAAAPNRAAPAQASTPANVDPAARQVLEAARDAIAATPSLSMQFSTYAEGNELLASFSPTADGTMLIRPDTGRDSSIRITGAGRGVGAKEDRPFDVAWHTGEDGEWASWVDTDKQRVYEQRTGTLRGSVAPTLDIANHARPNSMLNAFADELAASELVLEPSANFDGVNCRVIRAQLPARKGTVRWAFGAEDNLPRRWERVFIGNSIDGAIVVDFKDVHAIERLADADFTIPVPDGYEREKIDTPVGRRSTNQLQPGTSGTPTTIRRNEPAPAVTPAGAPMAPDFTAKDAGGNEVSLAALRGNVVVLDFWGTWCLPCKKSSPEVQKLHERFAGKNVRVIGVAVRERDPEAPRREFAEKGYTFTLVPDGKDIAEAFGIRQYPTFVIIGTDGELVRSIDQLDRAAGQTYEQLLTSIGDEIDAYLAARGS